MPARRPQDHNKPQSKQLPVDSRVAAVLASKPTALDEKFTLDGDVLVFTGKSGVEIRLDTDPEIGTLERMLELDQSGMNTNDIQSTLGLLTQFAGENAHRLRATEILPVFERWSWEVATAMGGVSLPESDGSDTI